MRINNVWLKDKRKNLSLTQSKVASKCGISRAYYCEIELGVKTPSVDTAKKIGDVLGFRWTIFFDEECSETQQHDNGSKPTSAA